MTSFEKRNEFVGQLVEALADLKADRFGGGLRVNGDMVYVESFANGDIKSVEIRTGWARHGGKHRFTKKASDVTHIAKQIRRVAVAEAERQAARDAYSERLTVELAREEAAGAGVAAVVEALNAESVAAQQGRRVTQLSVAEQTVNGEHTYGFEFSLNGLTEAQALAILAIVKG